MNLRDEKAWKKWVDANTDPYGAACVRVARVAMEILDDAPDDFDPDDIIDKADDTTGEGITGFMAGCVVQMISGCHARGDEFRRKWNLKLQLGNEGEKANESGGVLNPALLNIGNPKR